MANKRFIVRHGLDNSGDNSVVNTITNVAEPVNNSDAATKYYVDTHVTGGTVTSVTATSPVESTGGTTPVISLGTGANGQLVIGTGTGFTKSTLTAGTGVSIANASGSITISATGSGGDVVGPASSTDNAVVRFDGTTGKIIQNSTVILSDTGVLTVPELSTTSITSTGNNPIVIAPDGTGDVHLNADSVRIGDNNTDATLTTHGTGDLILTTHEGSATQGIIRLYDGANGNITITPNGTGNVGIGTASPSTKLEVVNGYSTFAGLRIGGTDTNVNQIWQSNSGTTLGITANGGAIVFGQTSSEQMRLTAGGSLGIGTQSPTGLLQLSTSSWRKAVLDTTGVTAKAYQGSDSNGLNFTSNIYWSGSAWTQDDATRACFAYIQHLGNNRMEFRVSPAGAFSSWTTAMVIDTSGNVGIGTSSPTVGLHVVKDQGSGYIAAFRANTSSPYITLQTTSGITQIQGINSAFTDVNNIAMQLSGGNVGIGTSSPAFKLHTYIASGTSMFKFESGANAGIYGYWTRPNQSYIQSLNLDNNGDKDFSLYDATNGQVADRYYPSSTGYRAFFTNGSERMRIDSSGNVGIGVTPSYRLDVSASVATASITSSSTTAGNQPTIRLQHSGNNTFQIKGGSNLQFLSDDGANERVRITNAGDVGIGTSSPSAKLTVNSGANRQIYIGQNTSNTNYNAISLNGSLSDSGLMGLAGGGTGDETLYVMSQGNMVFRTVGTNERMRIDSNGNVGIGTSTVLANFGGYKTLELNGTTGGLLSLDSNGTNNLQMYTNGSTVNVVTIGALPLTFGTNSTERMRIDSSGNVGIGVTPSAWTTNKAIQIGIYGAIEDNSGGGGGIALFGNSYEYASGAYKYLQNYYATLYRTYAGQHQWFNAPSGSAGNAITFTQAMTLDNSGNLGLGVTPSAWGSGWTALQLKNGSWFSHPSVSVNYILGNAYFDGTNYKYYANGYATEYYFGGYSGAHVWSTASSGNAGNSVTLNERMRITNDGSLGIGTSSPSEKLTVTGNIRASGVYVGNGSTGDWNKGFGGIKLTTTTSTPTGGQSGDFVFIY